MLFTKASEYALLALIVIAQSEEPIDVEKLSKQLNISKSFLAKILQNLAKKEILNSYKGANGGFLLSKDCGELSILEIILAVENSGVKVFECSPSIDSCPNDLAIKCSIWPLLNRLQIKIDKFLEDLKLKDLLEN